jgi:hypothetical protein
MWLQVEKTDNTALSVGPLISIGLAHYSKGKEKDKEVNEALNVLTMSGEKEFCFVIVALENFYAGA